MPAGLRALFATSLLVVPLILLATPADAYTSRTGVLTSFDGTPIVFTTFFPPGATGANPVPIVLRTHGWGGARETVPSSTTQALLDGGYAVITWDARGFGQSGGKTQLDSPDFEVRDTIAILNAVTKLPSIKKDADGVVAAMSGVSYAGGIQLLTSAFDGRIRAIAPEITWNDLRYSLGPNGVVKNQWIQLLFWAGASTTAANGLGLKGSPTSPTGWSVEMGPAGPQTGAYDTNLPTYYAETMALNGPSPDTLAALAYRSPASYAGALTTPTLLIQGWPDSLFVPNEAIANYQATLANGADAKLILYCGGHAGCPYTDTGQRAHLDASIVAWFDKHVKGEVVDTGAPVEWFTSTNVLKTATAWPIPGTTFVTTDNYGSLLTTPVPMSGGVAIQSGSGRPSDDPRFGRFRLPIPLADGAEITGIPHLKLELGAGTTAITKDATLFARLVDVTAGKILDGQTTAIRFRDNEVVEVDMVGVSYTVPVGNQIALEITPSDAGFLSSRFPGLVEIHATIDVPVVG